MTSHYNEFLAMDKADQERALAFMQKWEGILTRWQQAADPQEAALQRMVTDAEELGLYDDSDPQEAK